MSASFYYVPAMQQDIGVGQHGYMHAGPDSRNKNQCSEDIELYWQRFMKLTIVIFSLLISSFVVNAQARDEKCPPVVVVRKSLYDSFQTAKSNKESREPRSGV